MKISISILFLFVTCLGFTQNQGIEDLKGYYQFPIRPGEQNYLAGTVGEIRASHFHTGIDVKTYGQIGLPIYAVADGFISRIKVAPGGYGNVLYMQHKNGSFSVYAHLNGFVKPLQDFIFNLQYQQESFSVESFPKAWQFSFEKGELIGYSGNSGSSSGPHLHFEIRDPNHRPMDVLKLGFDEIKDSRAPEVPKIAFVTIDESARINGFFGRKEVSIISTKNGFELKNPVKLEGKIGIEIYSYDPMNDVSNKNGIIETELYVNDQLVFSEDKDTLNFGKQRNTLVHFNYPARQRGSRRFNRLYLVDGNDHNIYKMVNRGIDFQPTDKVTLKMKDSFDNQKSISFANSPDASDETMKPRSPFEIFENHLHFSSSQTASVSTSEWVSLQSYKEQNEIGYYLYDLRNGLPRQLLKDGKTIETDFASTIPPNQKISYVQEEFEAIFYPKTLFDTLYLRFNKTYDSTLNREFFHFKNGIDPLRKNATVKLKPELEYNQEKARVYSVFGKRTNFIGGVWKEDEIEFNTRYFVKYTILEDSIAPTATPKLLSQKDIRFRIDDKLSRIKEYRAEVDGQFIMMEYDPKKKLIKTNPNDPNIPFKGVFTLSVIDNCNNKTNYTNTL